MTCQYFQSHMEWPVCVFTLLFMGDIAFRQKRGQPWSVGFEIGCLSSSAWLRCSLWVYNQSMRSGTQHSSIRVSDRSTNKMSYSTKTQRQHHQPVQYFHRRKEREISWRTFFQLGQRSLSSTFLSAELTCMPHPIQDGFLHWGHGTWEHMVGLVAVDSVQCVRVQ
jgi:hypothetical protein